jgi:predicted HAD superfamily Cof-like phosphohydrolase
MEKLFDQRREFNDAFKISSNDFFDVITTSEYGLEFNMLDEELNEYFTACMENNRVEIADAIGDMLYLIIGTAYKHGLDAEELGKVMDEIHRSNMSKLHNGEVVKTSVGKVVKPDTFSPPNIAEVLELH